MSREVADLLKRFGHAARCGKCKTCQQKAAQLFRELKPYLSIGTEYKLTTAWGHATEAEMDPAELDNLVAKLIAKVTTPKPSRKNRRTS